MRHIMNILERVDFVSNLILTGTLLNLLFLSHVLKVSWRGWITGIAVGFGIYAAIGLIAAALRAELGVEALVAVDITQMAGLNICVIIWVIYLFLPERPFPNSGTGLAKSELEIWSKELEKLVSNQ
ncbi:MAG TPA: hypothetical protein VH596_17185 [Terriglobales bacterium]